MTATTDTTASQATVERALDRLYANLAEWRHDNPLYGRQRELQLADEAEAARLTAALDQADDAAWLTATLAKLDADHPIPPI